MATSINVQHPKKQSPTCYNIIAMLFYTTILFFFPKLIPILAKSMTPKTYDFEIHLHVFPRIHPQLPRKPNNPCL
jgi:hypothetical protein